MIDNTIAKIEKQIREAQSISDDRRDELLKLLAELKGEVGTLSKTDLDQARSIAGYTELLTHEAMRQKRNKQLLDSSKSTLGTSVEGFEKSHPRLVLVVNRLSHLLSSLGI
jgi:hypothetical protein